MWISERETSLELANLLLGKQTLYQLSYSRVQQILFIPCQPTCVAQIARRLSAVIVRASNFAFGDLRR